MHGDGEIICPACKGEGEIDFPESKYDQAS